MRLLAHAEVTGERAISVTQGWLAGELGAEAEAQLAAFFARRKALRIRPDPLAETIAAALLASVPALAIQAMRDGLVRIPQTLQACGLEDRAPVASQRVAAVASDLVELAASCPDRVTVSAGPMARPGETDPYLGAYAGRVLARAGAAPLDKIVPLLDEARTRLFALALLRELGTRAAAAAEAVERVAASGEARTGRDGEATFQTDHKARFQRDAAETLAGLGPRGLVRLGALAAARPEMLYILVRALNSNDDDCAAAASALIQLHFTPNEEASKRLLRERLQRCNDKKASSLLMLLLLGSGEPASDQDWLKVLDLEPAVLRKRALQTLGKSAAGPLQLGAVVELLDDSDASVRAVALESLLATPERVATCRRPLEDFAATAEASVAARVREALSTRR
jgi:hypothetical protein